jgi:hypothetical protein
MAAMDTSDPTSSDSWWVGYFATVIAKALGMTPFDVGRPHLERALKEYKRSPACTAEVRRHLIKPKGEK